MHNPPHANTNQTPHNRTINAATAAIGSIDPAERVARVTALSTASPPSAVPDTACLHCAFYQGNSLPFLLHLPNFPPSCSSGRHGDCHRIVFRHFVTRNCLPPWLSGHKQLINCVHLLPHPGVISKMRILCNRTGSMTGSHRCIARRLKLIRRMTSTTQLIRSSVNNLIVGLCRATVSERFDRLRDAGKPFDFLLRMRSEYQAGKQT